MRFTRTAITDWKTLTRELVVTFIGVLLALAASAWWGERHDRAREREYLTQLTRDVDVAIAPSNLPAAAAAESAAALATADLIRAYREPKPPPADSIARWLFAAENFASYVPAVGTARALLSTGDINLIRNDSVRTIVVAMVSGAQEMDSRTHDYRLKWQAQAEELERYTDFIALSAEARGQASTDSAARADPMFAMPPAPRREPFPRTDYVALLQNRDVYRTLVKMNTAHRNTLNILRDALTALRKVRSILAVKS